VTRSDVRPATDRCRRARCRDAGVAALTCGILALSLLSTILGPGSKGSLVVGALDIAGFAFVLALRPGDAARVTWLRRIDQ
jgi:hypothetical protein